MARRTWRLVDALLLFLLFLLPLMLIVGRGEGTIERPTLLFWLMLILPFLILPWLLSRVAPEERRGAPVLVAQRVEREATAADEFGALVAPVVDVERAYVEAGIPMVEGRMKGAPTNPKNRAFYLNPTPTVFAVRMRKSSNLVPRAARGNEADDRADRDTHAPDARLPTHHSGVTCNAGQLRHLEKAPLAELLL